MKLELFKIKFTHMFISKKPLKQGAYLLVTIFLAFGLSLSLQSLLAAWTAPTANPPANNVYPPVYNEHFTPATNALINMPLGVNGNLTMGSGGNIVLNNGWLSGDGNDEGIYIDSSGNVGVNDINPDGNFEVNPDGAEDNGDEFVVNGSGNVGIGTISPGSRLTIRTTTAFNQFTLRASYQSGGWARGGDIQFQKSDTSYHRGLTYGILGGGNNLTGAYFSALEDDSSPWSGSQLFLRSNGNVGINDTNPDGKFEVNPDGTEDNGDEFIIDGSGNVGIGKNPPAEKLDVDGNVQANAFYYSSDKAFKENIHPISNALEKVIQLRGVNFTWKKSGERSMGLIAQEVEKVFPELVKTNPVTGLKYLQYGNLVAPLVEAIKAQQKEIEEQMKLLKEQEEEINKLKKEIKELKSSN